MGGKLGCDGAFFVHVEQDCRMAARLFVKPQLPHGFTGAECHTCSALVGLMKGVKDLVTKYRRYHYATLEQDYAVDSRHVVLELGIVFEVRLPELLVVIGLKCMK